MSDLIFLDFNNNERVRVGIVTESKYNRAGSGNMTTYKYIEVVEGNTEF